MLFRSVVSALLLSASLAQNYETDCFPALVASDTDGDGKLNQDTEFLAFANAYGSALYPTCFESSDSLDLLLLGVYTGLSAEGCLTCSPLPSCCFNLQLSIDGAANADRTSDQQSALQKICDSTSAVISNCTVSDPVIGIPGVDEESFSQCLEKLVAADANGDEIITKDEFAAVATLPSNCSEADQNEFDVFVQGVYASIILTQCPIEDFLTCSLDNSGRNISVAGLSGSNGRTDEETSALQTICALTESIDLFPCGFGVDDNFTSTDCSDALTSSDTNGDGELSREEYLAFLNADCEEKITELQVDQQATFSSLACLSNLTAECITDNTTTISLGSIDDNTLSSICLTNDVFQCGEGVIEPNITVSNFSGCFEDIVAADENGDSFLSLDEFYQLHVLRAGDRCDIAPSLTATQLSAFQGLVCTSCVTSGDGFSCCSEVSNSSLVSIAGAANSENQTFLQATILVAVCASVELECFDIAPIVPSAPTTVTVPAPAPASPPTDSVPTVAPASLPTDMKTPLWRPPWPPSPSGNNNGVSSGAGKIESIAAMTAVSVLLLVL